MIILGINHSHDAGAALIKDGEVIAAVNEERLNRQKGYSGVPVESISLVMSVVGISPEQIDYVVVAPLVFVDNPIMDNNCRKVSGGNLDIIAVEMLDKLGIAKLIFGTALGVRLFRKFDGLYRGSKSPSLIKYLSGIGINLPVCYVEHHQAHIASAAYTSGWSECLVFSNDGNGDGYCGRISFLKNSVLNDIKAITMYHSLGSYYSHATYLCGFPRFYHVGKTTGLAAYGNHSRTYPVFSREIRFDQGRGEYVNDGKFMMNEIIRLQNKLKGCSREDIAAGIQKRLEEVLLEYTLHYIKKNKNGKVALAGGVHANVRLNQLISEIDEVDELIIHPNMVDGGLAVGAALHLWASLKKKEGGSIPVKRLPNVFLGPEYNDTTIEKAISLNRGPYTVRKTDDPSKRIAELLAARKIVARFNGRMEYGPRALGNRSIFYPATDSLVNKWLNKQLQRTEFMPFAPLIRMEDTHGFLTGFSEKTSYTAEFMTITYDVTSRCKKEAPAAVHVDGTARPQVVRRESNPELYRLISIYKEITGESVLINTSFNMHEEPIVCTPEDAIQTFIKSNIDYLALGPFMLERLKVRGGMDRINE